MPSEAQVSIGASGPRRRLIVCADDYGLTAGISRGIRDLLERRRISATSVMAGSDHWPLEAAALRAVAGNASIGLHLTLTDQVPLGQLPTYAPTGRFPPLRAAFRAGMLRQMPLHEIRSEIERQFESFTAHYGRPPAHIDGHHHIHQLPGVREIVVDLAHGIGVPVWVRISKDALATIIRRGTATGKAVLIGAPGRALKRLAVKKDLATNAGFTGIYDVIGETRPFAELVPHFLTGVGDNCLFMCHPGIVDDDLKTRDAMTTRREDEYDYLMSDAWSKVLENSGLELGPFRFR